jgi:hypothetical protein
MEAFNSYRFEQRGRYFPAYGAQVVMANSSGTLDFHDAVNDFRAKNILFLVGESSGVDEVGQRWVEFRCTSLPADHYPVKSLQRELPRRPSDFQSRLTSGIPDAERATEIVSLAPARPRTAPPEIPAKPKAA